MRFPSDPPRPLGQLCIYMGLRFCFRLFALVFYQIRSFGIENYPNKDGMLICSNHQSNLDPTMIGLCCPRRINYLGKKSLFEFKPLGWILHMIDTIPIDRDAGIGGMKETLRRLKRNESVLIFPEGTRSREGELGPLLPGFVALAKRIKSPLVPVAIDGAFAAWPPSRLFPAPGRIVVVVGKPIPQSEIKEMSETEILDLLSQRIKECFDIARAKVERARRG